MRLKHVHGLKGNTEFSRTDEIKFEEFQDYVYYSQPSVVFVLLLELSNQEREMRSITHKKKKKNT